MLVFSVAAEGMTLERYAQVAAEHVVRYPACQRRAGAGSQTIGRRDRIQSATAKMRLQVKYGRLYCFHRTKRGFSSLASAFTCNEFAALQLILREIVQSVRAGPVWSPFLRPGPRYQCCRFHNPAGDSGRRYAGGLRRTVSRTGPRSRMRSAWSDSIFHPQGWLYAATKEELSSLQPQLGDSAVCQRQCSHGKSAYYSTP